MVTIKITKKKSSANNFFSNALNQSRGMSIDPIQASYSSNKSSSSSSQSSPSRGGGGGGGSGSSPSSAPQQVIVIPEQKQSINPILAAKSTQQKQKQMLINRIKQARRVSSPKIISRIKQEVVEKSRAAVNLAKKGYDYYSGGEITQKQFSKEQEKINKDIDTFNRKYSGEELTESRYMQAQKDYQKIIRLQKDLEKKKEVFDKSTKNKIAKFVWGKGMFIDPKTGKSTILTGTVPLTPVFIPRNLNVQFLGTQRVAEGKIITDIALRTKGGNTVGIARGVTIAKKGRDYTITVGRTGKIGKEFPTGITRIKGRQLFAGEEISKSSATNILSKEEIKLFSKKAASSSVNIKKNIRAMKSIGIGRSATTKASKFTSTAVRFPSGKISVAKNSIKVDDFASIASSFTKKDISLIVGKTITGKRDKINFIGIIKGISSGRKGIGGISGVQKLQYQKALGKVVSVAAKALNEAEKIKGAGKTTKLAYATSIAKEMIRGNAASQRTIGNINAAQKTRQIPLMKGNNIKKIKYAPLKLSARQKGSIRISQRNISRSSINSAVKTATSQINSLRSRIKQLSRTKATTKQNQKSNARQRQRMRQKMNNLLKAKAILKKVSTKSSRITIPARIIPFIKIPLKKRRRIVKRKPTRRISAKYNVYARPVHGKKFRKINTVPLTRERANDYGAFATDNSLSRTYKVVRAGKKARNTTTRPVNKPLNVPKGYYSRNSRKFRDYRIRKGKKKQIASKIERTRYLIDTGREKRKITLAQLLSGRKRKAIKRASSGRSRLSKAQLNALAKGRAKLKRMRNRR